MVYKGLYAIHRCLFSYRVLGLGCYLFIVCIHVDILLQVCFGIGHTFFEYSIKRRFKNKETVLFKTISYFNFQNIL